ncbi:glycosyl hydrolase 115 family protein [Pseudoduganella sp. LjRoot289]|uniref:glycosyl hydrolase 115 family protein n=1 Tax=Pseudoduganella sp. LjRoot289 TaxID=3342314 RepID=UPI003ECED1A7
MNRTRWALAVALAAGLPALAEPLALYDGKAVASVVHEDSSTASLAAQLLARDLQAVSGLPPKLGKRLADCAATCVVIGKFDSALVREALSEAGAAGAGLDDLRGEWERYRRAVVHPARDPARSYLLIAGSDARGAVYGVVDLTREIGVSAWEWWADVAPRQAVRVTVSDAPFASAAPSVQYRGVFLNDEDWGLQPWAAKTYDPAGGDIGPRSYARIYELLWRLKANTIWPAMHDSTKPFYQFPGNPQMARDYGIVVGTSHAEPMMRNNVREWTKADGQFNFFTNRDNMVRYWQRRVEEAKDFENIYSVGLRGVHDSAMEGAETVEQARDAVAEVVGVQRGLLSRAQGLPPQRIPQVLTLYKEVLDVYKAGLKVPEDITLVWPDDNYGYLAQLSGPQEAVRAGGTGLYYHISYWGRPHDYLWLASTHPALIREQLDRAYRTGSRKTWIVNVGDIKPAEYLSQYFLDLAFDGKAFNETPGAHLQAWMGRQFGAQHAAALAGIMMEYYDLAWERRPEFMGFGQTEPTRPNGINAYMQSGGGEAARRIARYEALVRRAETAGAALPADRRDAYFELVLYPVRASANLNARILKLELAAGLARHGRAGAQAYVDEARLAHAAIVADTARYNSLAQGKWRHMMDMAPRRLPVFDEPVYPAYPAPVKARAPEPLRRAPQVLSLAAAQAAPHPLWETVPQLGSAGASLRTLLTLPSAAAPAPAAGSLAVTTQPVPPLEFPFEHVAGGAATIKLVALPVHPLTSANKLRLGVSLDGGPVEVLDFATYGRSDEWKRNVLSNSAVRSLVRPQLARGRHRLQLYAMDPGFLLDRIDIIPDGAPDFYGAPPVR